MLLLGWGGFRAVMLTLDLPNRIVPVALFDPLNYRSSIWNPSIGEWISLGDDSDPTRNGVDNEVLVITTDGLGNL